jgi:hypothetical protein
MKHLFNAIKRPFTDFSKLLIGIIFSIIPIVNFIAIGYQIQCAKTAMSRKFIMPKWENFSKLFITGILGSVIVFVYSIPALVLLLLAVATFVVDPVSFIASGGTGFDPSVLSSGATGPVLVLLSLGVIALALASLVGTSALINYSISLKFKDGFKKSIWQKAFTGKFFGTWLLAGIYGFLIAIILGLIPSFGIINIGDGIQGFIYGVTYMTALATIYKKL